MCASLHERPRVTEKRSFKPLGFEENFISEGTCSKVLRSNSFDSYRFESMKIFCVWIDLNCNFMGVSHHFLWLQFVLALLSITFQLFKVLSLTKDHWRGFRTKMRIWPILFIKSDLKCCILSTSLFLYCNYLCHCCWTRESEGTCRQVLRSNSVDS